MTKTQDKLLELELAKDKLDERINLLLNKPDRTDAETVELREATDSCQKLRPEIRATKVLAAAEDDKGGSREVSLDPEALELRQLTERSNIGSILGAVVEHRATGGPELELQQAHGLAVNQIPLDLLRLRPEERAVSPAPTNTLTMQDEIVAPVFADSAAAFLGVYQPTVPDGDAVYPVLTSRPTVHGPFTGSDDAADTTGAFDSELLAPGRIQASFFWKSAPTPHDSQIWSRVSAWR